MSIISRALDLILFRDLPANQPIELRAALPSVPEYQRGKAMWLDNNPAVYVEDGYNRVVVAYRCVNVLANAIASSPLRVYDDQGAGQMEPIEAMESSSVGRLASLIRDPNPFLSQTETIGLIAKIALASGFCVYEKERGPLGQVVALYPLRSDWLRPVPRGSGEYDWEYWVPGYARPFPLKAEDVGVFVAEPSPTLSPLGVAPLSAALREVAIENQMTDFVKVFFQNNAVPSFVAILKDDFSNVAQAEADVIKEQMQQRFAGGRGTGAIGIMPALERIERVALNFDEMAFPELRSLTSTQICTAFGVPPILIGIQAGLDASTYSNYEQARRAFYEDTVVPLWSRLDGSLTRALLSDFDVQPTTSLEFDLSEVPALQDDLTNERAQIIELWKSTVVSRNETRAAFGYTELADANGTPLPFGEEFYAPVNPFAGVLAADSEDDGEEGGRGVRYEFDAPGEWKRFQQLKTFSWQGVAPALPSGEKRIQRLPPETRATVATTARDAYDALAASGAPALRRFWKEQGERVVSAATRMAEDNLYGPEDTIEGVMERMSHDWRAYAAQNETPDDNLLEFRDIAAIDWDTEEDLLAEVLDAIHLKATRLGWLAADAMGVPASAYDIANPYVQGVLDDVGTRITGISATTQGDVQRIVGDALNEGVTMAVLAARLTVLFEETYHSRAVMVAHTESQVAYNLGTIAAGKDSGVSRYAELSDNPAHDTDPGSDGLTCAQRHGLIVPIDQVSAHVSAEHPGGSLSVALVVDALEE